MRLLLRFLRWIFAGLFGTNNRRAAFFWMIVVFLGLSMFLTNRFKEPWSERFQAKVYKSETLQKGHNILRGFGLKTDVELSKEQRLTFIPKGIPWHVRAGRRLHKRLVWAFWIGLVGCSAYTTWAFREEFWDLIVGFLVGVYQRRTSRSEETTEERAARQQQRSGVGGSSTTASTTIPSSVGGGQATQPVAPGTVPPAGGRERISPFWKILGADFVAEIIGKLILHRGGH